MAATRDDIKRWFLEGKNQADYMIIVCDTFDYEDYPVYVAPGEDFWKKYAHFDGNNMQRIMEIYDLKMDMAVQLGEHRARHCPLRTM